MTNIKAFIITAFLCFLILFLTGFLGKPYAPVQPIAFSHRIHAGDYQMNCLYCHTSADRSPTAGIPSVQRCMGCHKITAVNRPEIKRLHEYWNKKEPIPWVRVYEIPDFVYFTHRRHISSGIGCKTCHGEVEKMSRIQKVSSLKMGWCVKCHRRNKASTDCITCHK
jgi:hypothetical protein